MPEASPDTRPKTRAGRWWHDNISVVWRRSLRFRTLTVALLLTLAAVTITFTLIAVVLQNQMFDSRRTQVLYDAQRAVTTAQQTLDASDARGDNEALQAVMKNARDDIGSASLSSRIAVLRVQSDSPDGPQDYTTFSPMLISSELRAQVAAEPTQQWWQSVALQSSDGKRAPAIIAGQTLTVPDVGLYGVYIAYDLSDVQRTLDAVLGALWLAGIVLVALIGVIGWIVLRSIAAPVIQAAETSSRLAAGDFDVRLDAEGEDEIATLARSFNAMADGIQERIAELHGLSQVQQRFVSDVSHELRTPLTTIRLASSVLNDQKDGFDPVAARSAELLHAQVERFDLLLNDLLEISRYDAGSVQLELEPTSLAQLVESIVEELRPLATQHNTELVFDAPGGHTLVDVDPRRIRRIVRNLIGNAIEHGEHKPVTVTVDSTRSHVAVGVRDSGIGMAPEDAERVFDRFWRADPSRARTIGGTGLGLAIAQGDARLHGGTISVGSELGEGSNFVLELPRRGDETEAEALTRPIAIDPPARDPKQGADHE